MLSTEHQANWHHPEHGNAVLPFPPTPTSNATACNAPPPVPLPLVPADIALSADVRFYLRRWEGAYSLEWQGGDAAVVRFERDQDLKGAWVIIQGL